MSTESSNRGHGQSSAEDRPVGPAEMELRRVRLSDPIVAPLLADLAAEYETRYGPGDEMTATDAAEFDPPSGLFLALVDNEIVVAGGGFRHLSPGVCEVKRMWTHAGHRRRGHASAVLDALEEAARAADYRVLRLETGPAQPEATALYGLRGYRRIPAYGRYREALAFERSLVER
jgi:GNAT superfamily N-acetyltransferase